MLHLSAAFPACLYFLSSRNIWMICSTLQQSSLITRTGICTFLLLAAKPVYTWVAGMRCSPAPASVLLLHSEDLPIYIQLSHWIASWVSWLNLVWRRQGGGSSGLAAQSSQSQMPPVYSPGRASRWINATGELWIKWQEVSWVGKGRDPKTQSMRGQEKDRSVSGALQKLCDVPGVLMHMEGDVIMFLPPITPPSDREQWLLHACVQSDSSFQLLGKGRADKWEPWTKE